MRSIGIAMSGGVDSSVSASLLKKQGFRVHGFFMKLPLPGVEKHMDRVRAVAEKLKISLSVIDMQHLFKENVMDVFIDTYRSGSTPNPCIICNHHIKFGALRECMHENGMDKIATGHYARISQTSGGHYAVQRGLDPKKDQSYFLCRLDQEQLQHIIMPLGELTKTQVYTIAAEMGLKNVHGPESQDVCFLAGRTIDTFFDEQGLDKIPGDIVTSDGNTLGHHHGLWNFTVGQRRGLGLPDATPWYVQRLDGRTNQVIVCKQDDLITREALLKDVLWTHSDATAWEGFVQIRGRTKPSKASVTQISQNLWQVTFAEPQRAVTPGQYAAFYSDDLICGSGIITEGYRIAAQSDV